MVVNLVEGEVFMDDNLVKERIVNIVEEAKEGYELFLELKKKFEELDTVKLFWLLYDLRNEGKIVSFTNKENQVFYEIAE